MELARVPRNPVVVEVPTQDGVDYLHLLFYWPVSHSQDLFLHGGFRPAEALTLRLKHRLTCRLIPILGLIYREPKKRYLTSTVGAFVSSDAHIRCMSFLLRNAESELSEARFQKDLHGFHRGWMSEEQTKVVGITNEIRLSVVLRFDLLFKPEIQHVVEVNIGKQRRDGSALRRALFRTLPFPFLHDACLQPRPYQFQYSFIADSMSQTAT